LTAWYGPRILKFDMRRDGKRRLLALAALMPLLLVSVSGVGTSLFRCQLTGAVAADPCCPDEASPPPADAHAAAATVAATDCCLRETITFVHPPAEAPAAPAHDGSAIVVVAVTELAPTPALASLVNFVRAAQPDLVPLPPLRLVKRSLLI
jgi:hypothetical protein